METNMCNPMTYGNRNLIRPHYNTKFNGFSKALSDRLKIQTNHSHKYFSYHFLLCRNLANYQQAMPQLIAASLYFQLPSNIPQ
jgi:hypothetical protein